VHYTKPHPLSDLTSFDLASRGSWGSARLIATLRGHHLATVGAVITILAIAVDPFIQQVIRYHPCQRTVPSMQASISRSNFYNTTGIHTGALSESLDIGMQAAIYEGVFASFSNITPTCPTGNCTFPEYRTLGMCSSCEDISNLVNNSCGVLSADNDYGGNPACNFTLPGGLNLTIPTLGYAMMMSSVSTSPASMILSEIISFTRVLDYDKFKLVNISNDGTNDGGPSNIMALGCSLSPCVRTYKSEVTQEKDTDVLQDVHAMDQIGRGTKPYPTYMGTPMPCLINGVYHNASEFTQQNLTNKNEISGLLPHNQTVYLPDDCVFTYNNTMGISQYLAPFLDGYVLAANGVQGSDPDWMAQLYNDGNASLKTVNSTWSNLADSMTTQIRKNGDKSNSKPTTGVVQRTETCVSVEWAWLSLPLALLSFTFLFLFATIWQSSRHTSRKLWKASPLALLFHGMDNDLREKHRLVDQVDEMDKTASDMVVQISHGEGGLRFVDVGSK
jgi:Protein of unknown function (DUF3176)